MIVGGSTKTDQPSSLYELVHGLCKETIVTTNPVPKGYENCTITLHNDEIIIIGGGKDQRTCFQLAKRHVWKPHSDLNFPRFGHSTVATKDGTFVFGGMDEDDRNLNKTFEFMPKNEKNWLLGQTEIPKGFAYGSAIYDDSQEKIWLFGGVSSKKKNIRI